VPIFKEIPRSGPQWGRGAGAPNVWLALKRTGKDMRPKTLQQMQLAPAEAEANEDAPTE